MRLRRRGVLWLSAATTAVALLCSCTPEADPPANPTPTAPPGSMNATPTESAAEQQIRLDYEAGEKAYRANMAEQDRLFHSGGASKPTAVLKATATGEYLDFITSEIRLQRDKKLQGEGSVKIAGIVENGWKKNRVILTSCEDASGTRYFDRANRDVTPKGAGLAVQRLTIIFTSGRWKVADTSSKLVDSFSGQPCAPA